MGRFILPVRHILQRTILAALLSALAQGAWAQPTFVNGLVIPGDSLDATEQPGANAGRLGMFSDIYYDSAREEWWALSDRGPGGGLIDYATRLQRFTLKVDAVTGAISRFRITETVIFRDPQGLLTPPTAAVSKPRALNGLNPLLLNNDVSVLGRSFDPEGLVVDPRTGHFLVADEYGPSVYEFDRQGRFKQAFDIPNNLIPKVGGDRNYVAIRDDCTTSPPPLCTGRQDNRGFEGLAISPDGTKVYAVLQDPLINEGPHSATAADVNGRDGRNLRIVVFDNDPDSSTYLRSIAQYAYQLELQADVAARIAALKGISSPTDPRQGRNIGLSAITAINDHEFLVLERDNRGIGVDDPAGAGVVGSKRIYKIDIEGATNIATLDLPDNGDLAAAGIVPVTKSLDVFIDLAGSTLLPNGRLAEKWEGMTIGPKLKNGGHLILTGNDNDYSVTQNANTSEQLDVYVDFGGNFARCVIDDPTRCEINPAAADLTIDNPVPLSEGFFLLPGLLHAYKASKADLGKYVEPFTHLQHEE
jgi:hypothetical protein